MHSRLSQFNPLSLLILPISLGLTVGMAQANICSSAREFITTHQFLRSGDVFKMDEEASRKISESVSKGCDGAASRFIRTAEVLSRADVSNKDAIEKAIQAALHTESQTENFIRLFQLSFASKYLDLTLENSLKLAEKYSLSNEGNSLIASADFETTAEYCVQNKLIPYSKPECAAMASQVAQKAFTTGLSSAESFIESIEFLITDDRGPKLPPQDGLSLAQKLLEAGGSAADNYIQGYRYAISHSGLEMNRTQAMAFADQMVDLNSSPSKNQSKLKPGN